MSEQVTPGRCRPAPSPPAARRTPPLRPDGGVRRAAPCSPGCVLVLASPAWADRLIGVLAAGAPAAPTLDSVINGLRNWLVGLLAAVATLFLTIGGIRYITAGGDPMQVERAKTALKSAAIGYALAALSPLLIGVLRSIVG